MKKKFYQTTWFMILMLLIFPPVGIALLWVYFKGWHQGVKIALSAVFGLWFLILVIGAFGDTDTPTAPADTMPTQTAGVEQQEEAAQPQAESSSTTVPQTSSAPASTTNGTAASTTKPTSATSKPAVVPGTTQPITRAGTTGAAGTTTAQNPAATPQKATTASTTRATTTPTTQPTTKSTTRATTKPTTESSSSGSGHTKKSQEEYNAHQAQRYRGGAYILNSNSMLIHSPGCDAAARIADENYSETNDHDAAVARGYRDAGCCLGR